MPLDIIAFLYIHIFIKSPCWQSSGIIIILYKYNIVISDTVRDSCRFLFLLAITLSELHQNPRRKNWVTEKDTEKQIVWRTSFFLAARLLSYVIFCRFFLSNPTLLFTPILRKKNVLQKMVVVGVWHAPCSPSIYDPACRLFWLVVIFFIFVIWYYTIASQKFCKTKGI